MSSLVFTNPEFLSRTLKKWFRPKFWPHKCLKDGPKKDIQRAKFPSLGNWPICSSNMNVQCNNWAFSLISIHLTISCNSSCIHSAESKFDKILKPIILLKIKLDIIVQKNHHYHSIYLTFFLNDYFKEMNFSKLFSYAILAIFQIIWVYFWLVVLAKIFSEQSLRARVVYRVCNIPRWTSVNIWDNCWEILIIPILKTNKTTMTILFCATRLFYFKYKLHFQCEATWWDSQLRMLHHHLTQLSQPAT